MKKRFPVNFYRVALLASVVLLQGCLSGVVRPVSESNKISTATYDGQWLGTITNTAPVQSYSAGTLRCGDRTGITYPLLVKDGEIKITYLEESTYINSAGKFRLEIPMSIVVRDPSSPPLPGDDNGTLIVGGSLQSGAGFVTAASPAINNTGCTSKIAFERL